MQLPGLGAVQLGPFFAVVVRLCRVFSDLRERVRAINRAFTKRCDSLADVWATLDVVFARSIVQRRHFLTGLARLFASCLPATGTFLSAVRVNINLSTQFS